MWASHSVIHTCFEMGFSIFFFNVCKWFHLFLLCHKGAQPTLCIDNWDEERVVKCSIV